MCKSQAEGGQRCAGHCRERVARAKVKYLRWADPADLQAWILAETDYASTPEGQCEARAKLASGEPGPAGLPAEYWARIAGNGDDLRQRNAMIAESVRTATKIGDAFHAEVSARCPNLPVNVRSSVALERHLDEVTFDVERARRRNYDGEAALVHANGVIDKLARSVPDEHASFSSGTPRSQDEKDALLARAYRTLDHLRLFAAQDTESVRNGNVTLQEFGRRTNPAPARGPETSRDAGFVGRLVASDGSLSTEAYLVLRWSTNEGETVEVQSLKSVPHTSRKWHRPGIAVKGEPTRNVSSQQLVRADDENWSKFAGRSTDSNYNTPAKTFLQNESDRFDHELGEFKIQRARETGRPYAGQSSDPYH